MSVSNSRSADHPIDPIFLERWSPRAFTGENISEQELMTMLEAARWAPSTFNLQPWRFIWARRGTPHWAKFVDTLVPMNKMWAHKASALVYLVSHRMMQAWGGDGMEPSPTHSFDAGAASGYLALQAVRMGWHVHGMYGFDMDRAVSDLAVPADYRVEAAFAIGRMADKTKLPEEFQQRELPSGRKTLLELAFEGAFPA